jgi:hypothetical protein
VSVIRWEDPPPRRDVYDWHGIGTALMARPGVWALAAVYPSPASAASIAHQIRHGRFAVLRELGCFEAVLRTVEGEARVYARYVGVEGVAGGRVEV